MKVEYINPIIEAVYDFFVNVLDSEVKRGDVGITRELPPNRDVIALIGISGQVKGIVTLAFPVTTALAVVGKMVGKEVKMLDDAVKDSVSEIVNIVAGNARTKLNENLGANIELSLPTVVRGNNYSIEYPSHAVWLDVPFESDLGPFALRVTFGSIE